MRLIRGCDLYPSIYGSRLYTACTASTTVDALAVSFFKQKCHYFNGCAWSACQTNRKCVPNCWELDDKSNLYTLAHAVSIWTRTSKSYTTFIAKIIPSNLNICKINEMFNFNAMKKIGIDTTHVFHCGISYIFKCR